MGDSLPAKDLAHDLFGKPVSIFPDHTLKDHKSTAGRLEALELKTTELCRGDSGGGVFLAPGGFVSGEEPPLLLGVVSAGFTGKQCANSGTMMRADIYSKWIKTTLDKYGSP